MDRAIRLNDLQASRLLRAGVTTPAATLDGAIAKFEWVGKGIRAGHLKIDRAVFEGAIADIRRLAPAGT
jgi:hypothetical protein